MPTLTAERPVPRAHEPPDAPPVPPAEIKRRSIHGLAWTFSGQAAVFVAHVAMLSVLARLFTPEQMGGAALLLAATNLGILFGGFGLGRGLVQREVASDTDLATAFWGAAGAGLLAWIACAAAAPAVAIFFDSPELGPLLACGGAMFLLAALWQVPTAVLERQLRFRQVELAGALGYALPSVLIIIALALAGAGLWSLVAGSAAAGLTHAIVLSRLARWRPRARPRRAALRPLISFGGGVTGAAAVAFALANVDYAIVGRVLGPAQLGVYSIAYQLASIPRARIAQAVMRVAFPAFSRIQGDREQLNRAYIRLNRSVAFVVFPLLAAMFVAAEPLIVGLFGRRWAEAAPALRVLCPAGALMAVRATAGSALNAVGRPALGFYANLAVLAASVPALALAAPRGIVAVSWAVLAVSAVNFLPLQLVLGRLTGLRVSAFLLALVPPALLALGLVTLGALVTPWL